MNVVWVHYCCVQLRAVGEFVSQLNSRLFVGGLLLDLAIELSLPSRPISGRPEVSEIGEQDRFVTGRFKSTTHLYPVCLYCIKLVSRELEKIILQEIGDRQVEAAIIQGFEDNKSVRVVSVPPSFDTMNPSSGRPTTGRPTTGRPMTGRPTTGRPGTRGGTAAGRPPTQGQGAYPPQQHDQYIQEEWDEEEYESDDDGDVFAFVPPDLGPAPELQHNPLDPSIDNQNRQQHSDYVTQQHPASTAAPADQNETYYFDEATGAVYDSQGRLVDVSAQNLAAAAAQADAPMHSQVRDLQRDADPRASPASEITMNDVPGQRVVDLSQSLKPRASTDNRSYDSASTFTRDASSQPLNQSPTHSQQQTPNPLYIITPSETLNFLPLHAAITGELHSSKLARMISHYLKFLNRWYV